MMSAWEACRNENDYRIVRNASNCYLSHVGENVLKLNIAIKTA